MSSNAALNSEPVGAPGETSDRDEAVKLDERQASDPAASAEGAADPSEGSQAPRAAEDPSPAEKDAAPKEPARAPALQVPPPETAGPSLGDALSALDRRDYATAKRLFETLGRNEAAEAIDTALAALDRKDYDVAQGLFEALATLRPAAPDPAAHAPLAALPIEPPPLKEPALKEPVPLALVPGLDPGDRQPPPRPARTEKRRPRRLLAAAAVLAVFSVAGAAALGARGDWTFAAAESDARAGLASAVDLVKGRLSAMASFGGREDDRDAIKNLQTELADATMRLDRIER